MGEALLSTIWSVTPSLTLRRCAALLFTQIIGIYLYSEYGFKGMLSLLRWSSGISIILCFIFSIFFPVYGIQCDDAYDGVWRGIYINKNVFGLSMAIFTPIWLLTFLQNVKVKRSKYILSLVFTLLSLILLIKSQSKTSLVVCLIILFLIPICFIIRKNLFLAIGLFFATLTIAVFFFYNDVSIIQKLLVYIGKDATLTGRTGIWKYTVEAIENKPLLGYGYGVFYQGFKGPSEFICNLMGFVIFEAHNGYLNITTDLGFIGLLLFILSFLQNMVRSLALQIWYKDYFAIFPIIFIVYFALFNISESLIIGQNQSSWIIYSLISTYLSYELKNKAELNENHIIQFGL